MSYSNIVVTQETSLTSVQAPALPYAPVQYEQRYVDQLNNILRLYFNQIDTLIRQLKLSTSNTVALPFGAFHQDGVTTLSANMTNVSTTAIQVASTANFLSAGTLLIESEFIKYTGKTSTTFTGITRGAYGSTAAAHTAGVYVSEAIAVPSATTSAALPMSATDASNGVAIDGTDPSKIVFSQAGYYNIQFSAQLLSFDNAADNVTLWIRQNGTDVANSAGIGTVSAIHGGKPGATIISWNIILPITANQYVQVYFASDSGNTLAVTYPPGVSPTHPASPSVILTATFVSSL